MGTEIKQRDVEAEWQRLNVLLFRYEQIIHTDLIGSWTEVNAKFTAYFDKGEEFVFKSYPSELSAIVQSVNQLEIACHKAAIQWKQARQNNPATPSHSQQQVLASQDQAHIDQRRILLATTVAEVGKLDVFFETGTEGAYWSIEVDGLEGYDSLRIIRGGDRLVIYEDDGSIMFDEIIIEDHESGWAPYKWQWPYGRGQQNCGGLWVHWIPKGWSPQSWTELYNKANGKHAELYQLTEK